MSRERFATAGQDAADRGEFWFATHEPGDAGRA